MSRKQKAQSRGSAAHQPGVWHAGDARRVVPMAAAPHKLPPRQLQRTVVEAFLQRKHPILWQKRSTVVSSDVRKNSASGGVHLDDIVESATVALIEEALVHEHRNLCADGMELQSRRLPG